MNHRKKRKLRKALSYVLLKRLRKNRKKSKQRI